MNSLPETEQVRMPPALIPIKIRCGCGQKYAFDVDPSGGRMAYSVQCPICGLDGTTIANQMIAQYLSVSAPRLRFSEPDLPPRAPALPRPKPVWSAQTGSSLRSKAGKGWLMVAIGVLVVLVVVLAGIVFGRLHARPSSPANPADLANDGFPHSLKEIDTAYAQPPAGQNAATVYSQGFDALQIANVGSFNVPLLGKGAPPPLGSPIPVSMKSSVAGVVRANKDALRFFAQGAEFEQSRYPVDLTAGLEAPFPHLIKIKNAVQLVALAQMVDAENHDAKQAAKDVRTALALGRSLVPEPSLISQLVRATTVEMAVRSWERTANRVSLPNESLKELLRIFQKLEDYESAGEAFKHGLAADGAMWIAMFGTPQKLVEFISAPGVLNVTAAQRDRLFGRLQQGGSLREEKADLESAFHQILSARNAGFPDRLKTEKVVYHRLEEAEPQKGLLMRALLPGYKDVTGKEAACLASLRLGLTAVALEQFRAANDNRYPASLSELTPQYLAAIPADPFDGQPLRYKAKGLGYELYSVGPDLTDDSGRPMSGKNGDIIFAVIAPPRLEKNL